MKRVFTVIIIAVCFVLSGCHSANQTKQTAFFEWTDSYGRPVHLDKEPQRIVSLSPAITEILYLINAQDKLVGVSDFCNYPEAVEQLPKVGDLLNINMEALLAAHPDVVLIGSIVPKKEVETIEKLNIPVITIKSEKQIEEMPEMITILGKITGREKEAEAQAKQWSARIQALQHEQHQSASKPKSVYYVVGFGDAGDFTAPGNSHINEIIEMAGCQNIGKELKQWNVSREFLFQANPDIILIRKEDFDAFCQQRPYNQLDAVKAGHVYPIESGWIDIISPRNLKAIETLRRVTED